MYLCPDAQPGNCCQCMAIMICHNSRSKKMNNKNLLILLSTDKLLRLIFGGVILSAIALITLAITAGIWYL